jgi:hypothetical protein
MISGKLLRPLAVVLLAAVELASPTEAQSKSTMLSCGTAYPINCTSLDAEAIEIFCNAACPAWEAALCWPGGSIQCLTEPD